MLFSDSVYNIYTRGNRDHQERQVLKSSGLFLRFLVEERQPGSRCGCCDGLERPESPAGYRDMNPRHMRRIAIACRCNTDDLHSTGQWGGWQTCDSRPRPRSGCLPNTRTRHWRDHGGYRWFDCWSSPSGQPPRRPRAHFHSPLRVHPRIELCHRSGSRCGDIRGRFRLRTLLARHQGHSTSW